MGALCKSRLITYACQAQHELCQNLRSQPDISLRRLLSSGRGCCHAARSMGGRDQVGERPRVVHAVLPDPLAPQRQHVRRRAGRTSLAVRGIRVSGPPACGPAHIPHRLTPGRRPALLEPARVHGPRRVTALPADGSCRCGSRGPLSALCAFNESTRAASQPGQPQGAGGGRESFR